MQMGYWVSRSADIPNLSDLYPVEYIPKSVTGSGTLSDGCLFMENDASSQASDHPFSGMVLVSGSSAKPLSGSGILFTFKVRIKKHAVS